MRSEQPEAGRGRAFTVLAVCTGNVARSPAVERLLRTALGDDTSVTTASAGTHALVGHAIAEPMADLLLRQGVDPSGFAARQLEAPMVAEADLVLTLTRTHRSAVVSLHPRALRRAFTLRELAGLAADLPSDVLEEVRAGRTGAERLAALAPRALARRGFVRRDPADDDVVDPWRRDLSVYRHAYGQITAALDDLSAILAR